MEQIKNFLKEHLTQFGKSLPANAEMSGGLEGEYKISWKDRGQEVEYSVNSAGTCIKLKGPSSYK